MPPLASPFWCYWRYSGYPATGPLRACCAESLLPLSPRIEAGFYRRRSRADVQETAVNFFETIDLETRAANLPFLVIGGLAINLYGYSRETADLDLLICSNQRSQWIELFSRLDFTVYHDGGNFIQLSSTEQAAWPVDLMLVQGKTFHPMFAASREVDLYGTHPRVPSLEHLLALKLHALKNTRLNRFLKDFLDVENLLRINKLEIKSEDVRQLFLKYGTVELYEKVSRALAGE